MYNDPVSDLLNRIRNAQMAKHTDVKIQASKFVESVLKVLKEQGFVEDFERKNIRKGIDEINVKLKYMDNSTPVIKELKRISKPGLRIYVSANNIPKFYNGLGITILSTPKGVISDLDALTLHVGGEVLCQIF